MPRLIINHNDRRIITINVFVLIAIILSAGFVIYKSIHSQAQAMITSNLQVTLRNMATLIENQLSHTLSNTKIFSTSIFPVTDLENTHSNEFRNTGIANLVQFSEKMLQNNFSSISIYDSNNNLVLESGQKSTHSNLIVELQSDWDNRGELLWNRQFLLRSSIPIFNPENKFIGRITTEQPMPILMRIISDTALIEKSSDFLLCAPVKDNDLAINCFLRNLNGSQFKHMQRIVNGIPLPVHSALTGKEGVQFTQDLQKISIVAVYLPVAYGLGAVLTINEKELYSPFIEHIGKIFLYLSLLLLAGLAVIFWVTLPRRQQAIQFGNDRIKKNKSLLKEKNDTEKISFELTAYINTIGKLALISITDRNGKIVQVNDKLCEISGYSQEELIGQDHRLLSSHIHPQSFFEEMWSTITQGEIWHQEICNRNKSGIPFWLDCAIIPLINTCEEIDCYMSVSVDITARKQEDFGLSERVRESNCMQIIRHCMAQNLSTEKICQNILESLIRALHFPEMAVAMIELENKQIATTGYQENFHNQLTAQIISNGTICGLLKVSYLQDLPFTLPYEQNLIDSIAHDLGRWYEREEAEQRIIRMATHDALTGLPNRLLLQDRIEQALVHDTRHQRQMAVLFIDLDHFKTINDSLGHDIGDLLLKAVAERLLSCVRNEDTVARQGGDEFIVVLNSIAESLDAAKVAQKILDSITQPYQIDKNELHIAGSIGIAVFPDDGTSADALLKNSDVAMYYAKENGRYNYQFFTDELNKSAHERHTLTLDLRHALERNELVLYYQPVMDMPDNQLHSVEALLRWRHPEHKLITPDKFIGLAEETGLIIPIGEWVIKTVCMQIKAWQKQGYRVPRVAINLSVRQFRDKELTKNIARILNETGVEAKYISLEITESMLIDNIEKVIETLKCLSEMGMQISIDDFGTGYSSLSYLKRFPIHTLKIDRSFVRDIVSDKNDRTIVAAIIAMAHSLEIEVIAEGIETEEQLNLLIAQKCNHYQGYYFSKPVPVSDIENLLMQSIPYKLHALPLRIAK